MKKIVSFIALSIMAVSMYCKTIHIDHAYLMKKHEDGSVYVIRVQLEDGFHDWYVVATDKPWMFKGYEGDDIIIVDRTTDIATIGY